MRPKKSRPGWLAQHVRAQAAPEPELILAILSTLEPRAKLRYLRVVEAWPSARDRAIALLPPYAGTRVAEIRALDVADVRLSARKGRIHLVCTGEKSRTVAVHPCSARRWPACTSPRPLRSFGLAPVNHGR